jgi:TATA-box binding protein (TBP) (component of TFIID and TFIIIB)
VRAVSLAASKNCKSFFVSMPYRHRLTTVEDADNQADDLAQRFKLSSTNTEHSDAKEAVLKSMEEFMREVCESSRLSVFMSQPRKTAPDSQRKVRRRKKPTNDHATTALRLCAVWKRVGKNIHDLKKQHDKRRQDKARMELRQQRYDVQSFSKRVGVRALHEHMDLNPRVVNVVTLAIGVPVAGSGTTLPLDLHRIVCTCPGSYYAPTRFAAVQLAYSNPKCRVLVFHTGRVVGTGTGGIMASKCALALAQYQLSRYAGINVTLTNVQVINIVMASNLRRHFDCKRFADKYCGEAHYDRSSFVGLTWRPPGHPVCLEIYNSGSMNIPGAKSHKEGVVAFRALLPKILKFTSLGINIDNGIDTDTDTGGALVADTAQHDRQESSMLDVKRTVLRHEADGRQDVDIWQGWT